MLLVGSKDRHARACNLHMQRSRYVLPGAHDQIGIIQHCRQLKLWFLRCHRRCHVQAFVERENVLLTGSKDGHVRAWDLATQHCFQMLAGAYGEVPHTFLVYVKPTTHDPSWLLGTIFVARHL